MRILFLCGYNHPSHHRKVDLLANDPGFEILQIVGPDSGKNSGQYLSENEQYKYKVQVLPTRQFGEKNNPHRFIHWPLTDFGIRHFKPDIIHCEHEQESLIAAQVALVRDLLTPSTPLILHSWQNILRQRSLLVKLVCWYTLRSAHHVLCGNQEVVTTLRQQGYKQKITVTSIIGLDKRFFYPKLVPELRDRLGLQGIVVGYFGRRVPEKGVETFLRAIPLVKTPVQVVIGGSGPETENLMILANQLGIANRCLFLDGNSISYDDVVDYMNLLDILVVPSRTTPHWKEQLGRVVIEGMGCKITVVGSDSGAIPEVIGPGGCIFPEGDWRTLASIIEELASHPEKRLTLAELGYQRVLENYSVERLAENVQHIWQEWGTRT